MDVQGAEIAFSPGFRWGTTLLPGQAITREWLLDMTATTYSFSPSVGAYAQIFPRAMEAAGFDPSKMGALRWLIVLAGTWAEFALPTLIVLGLLTRFAALGMAGFVAVQSLTDVFGHGVGFGAWFDRASDAVIADQRALWMLLLAVLVVKGAGPLSADRLLGNFLRPVATSRVAA